MNVVFVAGIAALSTITGPGFHLAGARPAPGVVTSLRGTLTGVSADSAGDAWAVGNVDDPAKNAVNFNGFILRHTSSGWLKMAPPVPAELYAVRTLSATNAWIVGITSGHHQIQTLTLHWNGTQWSRVPSPNLSPVVNYLTDVDGSSATNVWAVGRYISVPGAVEHSLVLHWNGSRWSSVTSPGAGLSAVWTGGASNVWVVGGATVRHWDGKAWHKSLHVTGFELHDVTVVQGRVWAVGDVGAKGAKTKTAVLQLRSTGWVEWNTPNPAVSQNVLQAVVAAAPNDLWAVGSDCPASDCSSQSALVLHYNGSDWSQQTVPQPSGTRNRLFDITAPSSTQAWTVGSCENDATKTMDTLILQLAGTKWTRDVDDLSHF